MTNDLWRLSLSGAHRRFAARELLPSAVLEAVLERITATNPAVNAFATLDAAGARQAAAESDARWQRGEPLGELDGAMLSVKDNIPVKDLPCMWGNEVYRDFVPAEDEVAVARLRAAGAVILGKTNVSEFSVGRGIVDTRMFGTTRNPWNLARTTGSSSGGAVAAVASGMGQVALCTDGGGSIRIPASHCGLLGLKPTNGRVARGRGLPTILDGREVAGPVARTSDDLAALFRVIARSHPLDSSSWGFADPPALAPALPQPQRIRQVRRVGDYPIAPEVDAACCRVADNLRTLGHYVEEGPAPYDIGVLQRIGVLSQAGLAWLLRDKDWQGRIGEFYVRQVEAGGKLSATDYVDASNALRAIGEQVGLFFEDWDMMLSPATVAPPGPADEPAPPYINIFTNFANTAGVPAISVPAALSGEGTPIGIQLVGRFGADWELIAMSRQYEQAHGWATIAGPIG